MFSTIALLGFRVAAPSSPSLCAASSCLAPRAALSLSSPRASSSLPTPRATSFWPSPCVALLPWFSFLPPPPNASSCLLSCTDIVAEVAFGDGCSSRVFNNNFFEQHPFSSSASEEIGASPCH